MRWHRLSNQFISLIAKHTILTHLSHRSIVKLQLEDDIYKNTGFFMTSRMVPVGLQGGLNFKQSK